MTTNPDSHILTLRDAPEVCLPIVIVGAGACGLTAALAARDTGADVLVLERDPVPRGSTAMSSGLIPAAGSRWQQSLDIADSASLMVSDIQHKNHHQADPEIVELCAQRSAKTLHWLADQHGLTFSLVTGFLYPGHSVMRMHGTPSRTGEELMGALTNAVENAGIDLLCDARAQQLLVSDAGRLCGVRIQRPDGSTEDIGCKALILASSGFGGNADLVQQFIPDMMNAVYHGHTGNQGDAILWGNELNAQTADLGAYQGHGSVAWPLQTLITWSVMMMGGVQVNLNAQRFSNEHDGYSEQARRVLQQPDGLAWNIFDQRIHDATLAFDDYRQAWQAGAVIQADSVSELARLTKLDADALQQTLTQTQSLCEQNAMDQTGRQFTTEQILRPPFYAVKVTGALFHTQGGLVVNTHAQVLDTKGNPIPGLYAGGGAARGVSGAGDTGYLSGNGLLAAVMLGATAGENAAKDVLNMA
ncbi:FAD-dependent oxidoreductase [Orrella sp. 11846]|uniref:FAD-dependent oxidoreductase n=1 Tax=Orrella sp. 11846 TaxID=3409913 RepID=UPI003B598B1E